MMYLIDLINDITDRSLLPAEQINVVNFETRALLHSASGPLELRLEPIYENVIFLLEYAYKHGQAYSVIHVLWSGGLLGFYFYTLLTANHIFVF